MIRGPNESASRTTEEAEMNQTNAPRRLRAQHLALAAVLGIALVGLAQCRSVSDSVTGIDLRTPGTLSVRSSCQHRCNSRFKAAVVAEELRYRNEKRECGHNYACKKEADREHAAILRDLILQKRMCKHSCYNEGAGSGA